jgi:hypothetical protein
VWDSAKYPASAIEIGNFYIGGLAVLFASLSPHFLLLFVFRPILSFPP